MEQGNEGDEIMFLSYRQLGCDLPSGIAKVSQVTADVLIQIISTAFTLISNGEIKIPTNLPANIAVRHRICTDISIKIKDLGFLGECGYNQLLYPVEHQTRDLLKWIMEKIPRTAEEGTEEALGANALLNRNIAKSLQQWQKSLWKLPFCQSGKPLKNIYHRTAFSSSGSSAFASSLLHRHSLDKVTDARRAEEVNRRFLKTGGAHAEGAVEENKTQFANRLTAAFASASDKGSASSSFSSASNTNASTTGGMEGMQDKLASQMGLSLQELVGKIAAGDASPTTGEGNVRGTRFAHATQFSQESSADALAAALSAAALATLLSNNNNTGSSAAGNQQRLGDENSINATDRNEVSAVLSPQEKKAQQEAEEARKMTELATIKQEIITLTTQVESQQIMEKRQLELLQSLDAELKEIGEATEALEKECLLRRRALELIPSATENIAKLQAICDKGTERLAALQGEWDKIRLPLQEEIDAKDRRRAVKTAKVAAMIDDIKRYKDLMVPMVHDLKDKQDRAALLEEERLKLPKNLNRALYTHRILDITASIAKQNKEIEKITIDIRDLQKTINNNTSILQRADAITEELIFNAANSDRGNDPVMLETYKRLKLLRANFERLVETVTNIGATEKAARDLETKIDQEQSRVASYNFDRINGDLEAVKKENSSLLSQVKSLAGK